MEEECCHFYLDKKRRFCRIKPRANQIYCPEHACITGVQGDRKRIPCPLDPKHNCYEDDLKNHLRKCYVTKSKEAAEKLPYFVKNINMGSTEEYQCGSTPTMGSVKELTSDKLRIMIEKVNKLYSDVVQNIEKLYLEHSCIKGDIIGDVNQDLSEAFGDQALLRKEMLQQASLIGQLDDVGFLTSPHCFVELGAGKGKLSHWIQKATEENTDNSFILVERSSVRHKVDFHHRKEGKEENFQRIKIDIQNLCLGLVPGIQDQKSVIVVGKHLCGGATDLGIQCAINTLSGSAYTESETIASFEVEAPVETCSKNVTNSKDKNSIEQSRSPIGKDFSTKTDCCKHKGPVSSSNEDRCEDDSSDPPSKVRRIQHGMGHTSQLQGLMIALCCHHRCTWDTYVGRDFMTRLGITKAEFDCLTRLSSWATCARTRVKGKSSKKQSLAEGEEESSQKTESPSTTSRDFQEEDEEHCVEDLISSNLSNNTSLREALSVAERECIGRKAKRIIDMGRIDYLKSKNMTCCLREYIQESITPENIVLLVTSVPQQS